MNGPRHEFFATHTPSTFHFIRILWSMPVVQQCHDWKQPSLCDEHVCNSESSVARWERLMAWTLGHWPLSSAFHQFSDIVISTSKLGFLLHQQALSSLSQPMAIMLVDQATLVLSASSSKCIGWHAASGWHSNLEKRALWSCVIKLFPSTCFQRTIR